MNGRDVAAKGVERRVLGRERPHGEQQAEGGLGDAHFPFTLAYTRRWNRASSDHTGGRCCVHTIAIRSACGSTQKKVDLRPDPGYEKLLADGNERIGGNLVVEIIPQDRSRVAVPEEGARIEVVGPWVEDTTHGWNEIHPAWWVSAGAIEPASATELRRAQLLLQGVEGAAEEDDG